MRKGSVKKLDALRPRWGDAEKRVVAVVGDLAKPRLGLAPSAGAAEVVIGPDLSTVPAATAFASDGNDWAAWNTGDLFRSPVQGEVNVVKLKTDNVDPRRYMGRLEAWQKRVEAAGAREWRVINDLERLDALLARG